eukprot:12547554-Ditylum_brightwellii.AAC.1
MVKLCLWPMEQRPGLALSISTAERRGISPSSAQKKTKVTEPQCLQMGKHGTKDSSNDESWGIDDDDMPLLITCHNNNSDGDEDSSISSIPSLIFCQNNNSWTDEASNTGAGCDDTSDELVFDLKNDK